MFHEDMMIPMQKGGWIEVICGSMFSGKTEELIRRLKRVHLARLRVKIFKPDLDNRYDTHQVVSHDKNKISGMPIKSAAQILSLVSETDVVGIDEAQFFDESIVDVCNQLADEGIRVVVAGLDMDFLGRPFGPMPRLMAIAEYVTKVHAVCVRTGDLAHYTHRKTDQDAVVVVGGEDMYEPLSRASFYEVMKREGEFLRIRKRDTQQL